MSPPLPLIKSPATSLCLADGGVSGPGGGERMGRVGGYTLPFYIVGELQTKETLRHLASLFLWDDWSWEGMPRGGGHCFGTAPSCCLCFPILQEARNSVPAPSPPCCSPPCVYIRYKPSTKAAVLDGGGGGSLPWGVWREGAALFVTVFFVLSQLGGHGRGEGLIHCVQCSSSSPSDCEPSPPLPSQRGRSH